MAHGERDGAANRPDGDATAVTGERERERPATAISSPRVSALVTDTLWLLRHGQRRDSVDPEWHDVTDRVHDPPLTDHGHWQATRAADRLRGRGIVAVYASPFLRTVQTADAVADALDLPIYLEAGLCEHLNPSWFDAAPEILTHATLAERFARVSLDHESVLTPTFPESGPEAAARATEATRRLLKRENAGPVLLVGHGLTVGGVATGLTDVGRVETPLAGLTRLDYADGRWTLGVAADTAHLDG